MAETVVVSDEFMEFYGKEADAVAAAQQAEASSGNVPFDIGASGICVVKSIEFGKSKDKEVEDPHNKSQKIFKKGHPMIKMVFLVIDHPYHSGEQFQKTWYLWENDTTSRVDNYKRFLDECEKRMGLTREVRENPNFTPKMLADFFTSGDPVVTINWKVVENAKNTYDGGKEIYLSIPKEIIPVDSGLVPTREKQVITSADVGTIDASILTPIAKKYKIGDTVKYLELDWKVEADMGTKLVLLNSKGESKIVKIDLLD